MEQPGRPALLRCFICAVLFSTCAAVFAESTPGGEPQYCTVYNHMVKAGGTSIKEQLIHGSVNTNTQRPGLCTSDGSSSLASCYDAVRNSSVIMGYGEVLRHSLLEHGRDCQFFTMMRHPIDQLVSAFYYCPEHDVQRRPSQWCGDSDGEADPITRRLVSFARRQWTNMTYRQMLHSIFCQPGFDLCPPQLARLRTHRPYNINTEESRESLEKIENILLSYTAVGIFEEWDLSMELFDARVVSSVRGWDKRVAHNPGPASPRREALLKWALVSPDLHDILSADVLLYNFSMLVFKHQTAKALGKVWE